MRKWQNFTALIVILIMIREGRVFPQTTPPTVTFTTPTGVRRGTTVTFTIEGTDLAGAKDIVFSEPGLTGKILSVSGVPAARLDLEPKVVRAVKLYFEEPSKVEARVEITAELWMATGTHQFRMITPHGSSTPGRLVVSDYPELEEHEPNSSPSEAQQVNLPATINGLVLTPGDDDYFRFQATAGQEIVFLANAEGLGSRLEPVLYLFDPKGSRVASSLDDRDRSSLGFKIPVSGSYKIRVSDYQQSGSIRHFYRLTIGQFPFLKGRFPLGLKAGTTRDFKVWGYNLTGVTKASPEPFGLMPGKVMDTGALVVQTKMGETINSLPIAVGRFDEIEETAANNNLQSAQELKYPIIVNGTIGVDSSGGSLPDYYHFSARKGQKLILEVAANRLGSPLDSVVEVLDESGKVVPRVVARAVYKTQLTLRDRESTSPGLRLFQPTGLDLHDYMVAGNDLIRIVQLTSAPGADEDIMFDSLDGERLAFEDTTPEAHALDESIYKVELFPPGTQFPPNGMPVFHFDMRNDDGGPGYGKDSRVMFTAPADGVYYAKVADVRDHGGDDFAYRFTIREPNPDYLLSAKPGNPNIPEGSSVAVVVTALRQEGFEGPIHVEFEGIPEGIQGTSGTIGANENSLTLILSHRPGTHISNGWGRYRVIGKARISNEAIERVANGGDFLKLIALMPKPDVKVYVKTLKVTLTPGGEAKMTLAIERQNNFKGRVLFRMEDLPFGVRPVNVGLNGIMIAENETERTFMLDCRPWVKPVTKSIYVVGQVEALVPTEHPSVPVTLEIQGTERASAK